MVLSIERTRFALMAATALALVLATVPAGAAGGPVGTGEATATAPDDAAAANAAGASAGNELAESATQATAANNSDENADDTSYDEDSSDEGDADTAANEDADTAVARTEEGVVVTAPRPHRRGEYGAPIRTVSSSRDVSFADLDLTTDEGAMVLETRIRSTARTLCRNLEIMHPVAADDSPPCYQTAVADAMAQAEDAIAQARDE